MPSSAPWLHVPVHGPGRLVQKRDQLEGHFQFVLVAGLRVWICCRDRSQRVRSEVEKGGGCCGRFERSLKCQLSLHFSLPVVSCSEHLYRCAHVLRFSRTFSALSRLSLCFSLLQCSRMLPETSGSLPAADSQRTVHPGTSTMANCQ